MRLWWKSREQNADLLAFEGEFLTFQVDRELPLGKPVLVEAHLPDQEGHFDATLLPTHEIEPDATLKSFIEELHYAPRRHVYCARLEEPKASEPHLRILLEQLPASLHHHHRLTPRLPRHISVVSPDLPRFRGTTLDISLTGLSLRVDEPLEPGRILPITVIFDDGQFPPLQTLASLLVPPGDGRICRRDPLRGPDARAEARPRGLRAGGARARALSDQGSLARSRPGGGGESRTRLRQPRRLQ